MTNPYRLDGPALISFSGGRTSGFMLWHILDAFDGQLPDDIHVTFANTGKEREETLRFVHECESRWGVRVHWLEFETDLRSVGASGRFREVGYNSAGRSGEPFDKLIARKNSIPSTATGRWCTEFLKVKVMFDFAETLGLRSGDYTEVIGLRSDESARIDRLKKRARDEARQFAFPLSSAGVRKADVFSFWKEQDFDLRLGRGLGNCDQCPFVGDKSRVARAQFDPGGTEWWARHEFARKFRFGRNYSMVEILGIAARSPTFAALDDADGECGLWCAGEAA